MLELSMTLPIKVQNGGLFISRGVGRHPARRLASWEIIFVEKGQLAIQEEEHTFYVEAGESLLLWPHRRHTGAADFPTDLKFYWLHFEVKAPDNDPRWLTHLSVPQHTQVTDPQALVALFRQFMSEQEKLQRGPALEFIVLLILQQLTCSAQQRENNNDAGSVLAWKARQLIRTQYHLALSTAILAKELHCNADYLGRVYRRVFHLTLTEAIHRQRVREAEKLLISDACSLKEVAELCGFNDVGYFRQIFRKNTGLTPATWKQRYCKEHINSA
ncbi:helix-turn-helix domain-containing protein [Citrobacter sp. S2-9]|uniref:Helix-turn-helix domain-containing protein n=1 Tax=Citrobacter enshiensis TaxID=2971264 RepID=A0ABT8PY11_9ENTR|nr:helix-turn-helix domain-containing protein [Citrobacter enshiensis]MDN8600862.1 helix-turn-helix domain-containing protein [Citrobacter enshiensis]